MISKVGRELAVRSAPSLIVAALAVLIGFAATLDANADEKDARRLVKAMSDYLTAQKAISFDYDVNLQVVTVEKQTLDLASSGTVTLHRPDKIRAERSGGFADVEMLFDGKTMTFLAKTTNRYTQVEIPGTIDHLIDELRNKYSRPLPAADLLTSKPYDHLMPDVVDIKDLGSGVVGGVECDHLAFRSKEVDWQIWIAQGDRPYPCRYQIKSKLVEGAPQYSVQVSNWKTGDAATAANFGFKNSTKAKKTDLKDLPDIRDLPEHFHTGANK